MDQHSREIAAPPTMDGDAAGQWQSVECDGLGRLTRVDDGQVHDQGKTTIGGWCSQSDSVAIVTMPTHGKHGRDVDCRILQL